jgi:hypothetical protein
LQGCCAHPEHNHTDLHYNLKYENDNDMHPIYMNIKMVKKDVEKSASGQKKEEITRLAIGKPGGVDAEADKWDTHVKAFCMKCKVEFSP